MLSKRLYRSIAAAPITVGKTLGFRQIDLSLTGTWLLVNTNSDGN